MKNSKTHLLIILSVIISISGYIALNKYISDHSAFLIGAILFFIYYMLYFTFKDFDFSIFIYAIKNYDLLKICCEINLKKIIYKGSKDTSILCEEIKNAKEVKALFVTATNSFLADHNENLRDCISNGGFLKVIIATRGSQFIKDIEEIEDRDTGSIDKEIDGAIEKLKLLKKDAKKQAEQQEKNIDPDKLVEYKHFSTQLRSSIILIDDKICYVVPNAPPIRSGESLGFLFWGKNLNKKEGVKNFFKHFDELYKLSKKID